MTINPARILGLPGGRLQKGAPADIVVIDMEAPFMVDKTKMHSRSRNTPFDEARMQGIVKYTMVAGKLVYPFKDDLGHA